MPTGSCSNNAVKRASLSRSASSATRLSLSVRLSDSAVSQINTASNKSTATTKNAVANPGLNHPAVRVRVRIQPSRITTRNAGNMRRATTAPGLLPKSAAVNPRSGRANKMAVHRHKKATTVCKAIVKYCASGSNCSIP